VADFEHRSALGHVLDALVLVVEVHVEGQLAAEAGRVRLRGLHAHAAAADVRGATAFGVMGGRSPPTSFQHATGNELLAILCLAMLAPEHRGPAVVVRVGCGFAWLNPLALTQTVPLAELPGRVE